MKKYIQITAILAIFFALVAVRQMHGSDDERRIIGNSPLASPVALVQESSSPLASTIVPQTQVPSMMPTTAMMPTSPMMGKYKDGTYTGIVADAFYGNVQVQAVIQNGKIATVTFLQYPNDRRTSVMINGQAMPLLTQEAIQAQSAQVDGVSGATQTSRAFIESLTSALNQAK